MFCKSTKQNDEVLFYYNGQLNEEVLTKISGTVRQSLKQVNKKTAASIFYIFIELAQNILRYSYRPNDGQNTNPQGNLSISIQDDRFFVCSENLIHISNVPDLKKKLALIDSLTPKERRKLYKKTLSRKNAPKGSKGAGVGFIEIFRHSAHGLEYTFTSSNDQLNIFSIRACL